MMDYATGGQAGSLTVSADDVTIWMRYLVGIAVIDRARRLLDQNPGGLDADLIETRRAVLAGLREQAESAIMAALPSVEWSDE